MIQLHLIIAASIRGFAPPPMTDEESYTFSLRRFDWWFEFSEDPQAYQAGLKAKRELLQKQPRLDPLFIVWNEFAPINFKRCPS